MNTGRDAALAIDHLDFAVRDRGGRTYRGLFQSAFPTSWSTPRLESKTFAIGFDVSPTTAGLAFVYKPAAFGSNDEWVVSLTN